MRQQRSIFLRSNGKSASRSVETENSEKYFRKRGLGSKSRAIKRLYAIMLTISRRRTLYMYLVFVWACRAKKKARGRSSIVCVSRVSKSIYLLCFIYIYIYIYIYYIYIYIHIRHHAWVMYEMRTCGCARVSRKWPTIERSRLADHLDDPENLSPFTPSLFFHVTTVPWIFVSLTFFFSSAARFHRDSRCRAQRMEKKKKQDHSRDLRLPIDKTNP